MPITRASRTFVCVMAAITVLAGVSAAPAQSIAVTGKASTGTGAKSTQVGFGDLDLRAQPDRARLDRRLRRAAGHVCGGSSMKGLAAVNDHAACATAALDDATSRVRAIEASMVAGGGGG